MKEVTHPQFLYQIAFEERSQDLFEVALKSHTVLRECDGLLAEVWINTVQHSEELICNIFRRPKGKEGIAIQFRGMLDSINPYLG